MEFFTADKYIALPRFAAYNKFLDDKNLKTFRTYLIFAVIFFAISLLITSVDDFSPGVFIVIAIDLVFLLLLRLNYKRLVNTDNIRKFLYFFLIAQIIYASLINFSHILAGHGDEDLNPETVSVKDSLSKKDTAKNIDSSAQTGTDTTSRGDEKLFRKDTIWSDKDGGLKVTLDFKSRYDTFAEWLLIIGISLLFFKFSKNELLQLWGIGLAVPVICEFLIYGTLSQDDYIGMGITYALLFFIAYTSEKRNRRKFYDQYDFYLKKNFESMRMKKELDSAKEIQLSMLPESNSVINGIEIAGTSLPASEVGGDYFDYFKLSDTKLGVFVCDVSGHGVASGLMLSGLRSCMHLILEDEDDPKIVMEKLNRMVRKTQHRKMFVTAVFALIDTGKSECRLFNAGHLPPYKISASSGDIFKIKKHGITLGALENISIPDHDSEVVFDFNPGDKIVFYTDGLNEAMDPAKSEYGFERIENVLYKNTDKSPSELIDLLVNDVNGFIGENEQIDDLTILIIGRK